MPRPPTRASPVRGVGLSREQPIVGLLLRPSRAAQPPPGAAGAPVPSRQAAQLHRAGARGALLPVAACRCGTGALQQPAQICRMSCAECCVKRRARTSRGIAVRPRRAELAQLVVGCVARRVGAVLWQATRLCGAGSLRDALVTKLCSSRALFSATLPRVVGGGRVALTRRLGGSAASRPRCQAWWPATATRWLCRHGAHTGRQCRQPQAPGA